MRLRVICWKLANLILSVTVRPRRAVPPHLIQDPSKQLARGFVGEEIGGKVLSAPTVIAKWRSFGPLSQQPDPPQQPQRRRRRQHPSGIKGRSSAGLGDISDAAPRSGLAGPLAVNEYRIDHPVRKLGTRPAREPSPIHRPVAPGCRRKSGRRIRSRFGRSGSSPRPGRSP